MTQPEGEEPPGWAKLCALAQKERDPEKFQALIERINRLLDRHENRKRLSPDRLP